MSPIADFFRRHHAVPATNEGPDWSRATDATSAERQGQAAVYRDVAAEVQRRAERPDASPEIMGAAFRAASPLPRI